MTRQIPTWREIGSSFQKKAGRPVGKSEINVRFPDGMTGPTGIPDPFDRANDLSGVKGLVYREADSPPDFSIPNLRDDKVGDTKVNYRNLAGVDPETNELRFVNIPRGAGPILDTRYAAEGDDPRAHHKRVSRAMDAMNSAMQASPMTRGAYLATDPETGEIYADMDWESYKKHPLYSGGAPED